jgi:hypothetical protein
MEELEASTTGAVYGSKTPTAADHRDDIIMWMSFWPFSVWWRILKDPVRWAFVSLFEWFQSGFDRIAKSMFADVEKLAEKKSFWKPSGNSRRIVVRCLSSKNWKLRLPRRSLKNSV